MTSRAFALLSFLMLNSCGPYGDLGGQDINANPANPIIGKRMLVESGPVSLKYAGVVQGRFSIRRANENEYGIEGSTGGGACLLARVQPAGGTCMRDSDCTGRYGTVANRADEGAEYCIGQSGDLPNGSCFVKPDKNYCRKGVGPGLNHDVGPVVVTPVRNFANERHGSIVDWIVYSCLNGPDVEVRVPGAGATGETFPAQPERTRMAKPCSLRFTPVPGMIEMYSAGPPLRYR